ncbi:PcfJ domain-containing protein [Pseudomonadota bacterium]
MLHGSQQHCTEKAIGGRVIHNIDVLDIEGHWLSGLVKGLALGLCEKAVGFYCRSQKKIEASLLSVELELLRNAMQSFIWELDTRTIAILNAEWTGRTSIYNHYVSAIPSQRRNRVQAAESFPWFSRSFRSDWKLRQAIENGKPLATALATRYKARPRTIKYFQRFNQLQLPEESMVNAIKAIDNYTAEYFPATEEDHKVFMSVADTLDDLVSTFQIDPSHLARPFINGWKLGVEQLEASLGRALNLESIFDMAQASFHYGVKPALHVTGVTCGEHGHPPAKWFQLWFGHYGLKRLLEMAYRWEHLYGHFSLKRLGVSDENDADRILSWPQLLPSSYCHGPYRVVELTSQHELETEGRKLEHCIASYGMKCLVSGSFIYSIRDRFGNHLSTFEIQFKNGMPELQQHKALLNEEPESGELAVVERFIKCVLSNVAQSRIQELHGLRNEISLKMRGVLAESDSYETELTEDERNQLGELVEFTHPAAAVRGGINEYMALAGIAFENRLADHV